MRREKIILQTSQHSKRLESDHKGTYLEVNLIFSSAKPDRMEIFQFKNTESQGLFKSLTTETLDFTNCFEDDLPFEIQAQKWRKCLNTYFHKSFKKVRITNKPKKNNSTLGLLLSRRSALKKKLNKEEKDDEEILKLEELISEECQDENRKKGDG